MVLHKPGGLGIITWIKGGGKGCFSCFITKHLIISKLDGFVTGSMINADKFSRVSGWQAV